MLAVFIGKSAQGKESFYSLLKIDDMTETQTEVKIDSLVDIKPHSDSHSLPFELMLAMYQANLTPWVKLE